MEESEEQLVRAFHQTHWEHYGDAGYWTTSREERDSLRVVSAYNFGSYLVNMWKHGISINDWFNSDVIDECENVLFSIGIRYYVIESKTEIWEAIKESYAYSYIVEQVMRNLPEPKVQALIEKDEVQVVSELQDEEKSCPLLEIQESLVNEKDVQCLEIEEEAVFGVQKEELEVFKVPAKSDYKEPEFVEDFKVKMEFENEKPEIVEESFILEFEKVETNENLEKNMKEQLVLEVQKLESSKSSKKFDLTYCRNMIGSLWYLNASSPNIECTLEILGYSVENLCVMHHEISLFVEKLLSICEKETPSRINCEKMMCLEFDVEGKAPVNEVLCFEIFKREGIGVVCKFNAGTSAESKTQRGKSNMCDIRLENSEIELCDEAEIYRVLMNMRVFDPGIVKIDMKMMLGMVNLKKQGGVFLKYLRTSKSCVFVGKSLKKERSRVLDPGISRQGSYEVLKMMLEKLAVKFSEGESCRKLEAILERIPKSNRKVEKEKKIENFDPSIIKNL